MNPAPLRQKKLKKKKNGMVSYTTNISRFRMKDKFSFSSWTLTQLLRNWKWALLFVLDLWTVIPVRHTQTV